MFGLSEWKDCFSKMIQTPNMLGESAENLGCSTRRFFETYEIAREYLSNLVPHAIQAAPPFKFFDAEEIEENLTGLSYSDDFQEIGFFPIGELDNDKLICIDCDYPAFVVVQLGMGTIQPLRKFLLFRATQFSDFLNYMKWKIAE